MKKATVFLAVVILLALMIMPTFAYSPVTGSVIDSITSQPWQYGGEIYISGSVSNLLAGPVPLPVNGNFSIPITAIPGETITVVIDFTCAATPANCIDPPGDYPPPGTNTVCSFTELAIPIPFGCGFIETGTGPTAVSLQDFGTSTSNLPLLGIGFVVVALAGITFVTIRRRQTA